MSMMPQSDEVTVVVVTWNGAQLLPACLDSLRAQTTAHRVIVVDNASADATLDLLAAKYPDVQVIASWLNTGFAGGVELALPSVTTPYVALLNNDATAEPGWLAACLDVLARRPATAAVTSRILLSHDGRINNAGGALTRHGSGYDRGYGRPDGPPFDEAVEVAAFCGGAAVLRTQAVRAVGGVPAEYFLYYEDTDLSWRLRRAGHDIQYVPDAIVHHLHSASSDQASARFAFYNQRNQLLTLIRNAPLSLIATTVIRYLAITALDLGRRVLARTASATHQHRPGHRIRVLGAVLAMTPGAVRARRANRALPVSRREFCRTWLGVEARPLS